MKPLIPSEHFGEYKEYVYVWDTVHSIEATKDDTLYKLTSPRKLQKMFLEWKNGELN